ncbi:MULTISPECIES: photosystem II protein N [Spirulina sp. CCY15215]|jgi:PsbN protein|nr:photosystem II protein N [Spirulina major]
MEPATVFIIGIGILLLAVTAYSIYMSFGAPSAELLDPFDEHED